MKPDTWMPFWGDKFFTAVKGRPDFVKLGYITGLWYFWSHNHCIGLENNSDFLRGVCEVSEKNWAVSEPIIFDNNKFFTLNENGLWIQTYAVELWNEKIESYRRRVEAGKTGAKKRWH
ncbi:MAG: hypothetical protein KGL39_22770 [Patescibacteria group bacterium]|nr:hypothetical protein [Patescibacteria group bacterium]